MEQVRLSVPEDVPAQRELWALAFGDSGAYVDNFYHRYYRPERVLVLEEEGVVRAMTAWFDTTFVVPGQGEYRAAYLYAVATHPDCRGRGLAGRLLAGADDYFRSLGIPAVTTVPAEPSLHRFFGANGFRECFHLTQWEHLPQGGSEGGGPEFYPVSPARYGELRERLLAETPHIAYPEDALAYQEGCCLLSGGGLYAADTPDGPVLLCVEGAGNGVVVGKEFLGCPTAKQLSLPGVGRIAQGDKILLREPLWNPLNGSKGWNFAMLKWLDPEREKSWNWNTSAYLGLAFD